MSVHHHLLAELCVPAGRHMRRLPVAMAPVLAEFGRLMVAAAVAALDAAMVSTVAVRGDDLMVAAGRGGVAMPVLRA